MSKPKKRSRVLVAHTAIEAVELFRDIEVRDRIRLTLVDTYGQEIQLVAHALLWMNEQLVLNEIAPDVALSLNVLQSRDMESLRTIEVLMGPRVHLKLSKNCIRLLMCGCKEIRVESSS